MTVATLEPHPLPRSPHPGEFDTAAIDRHLKALRARLARQRKEQAFVAEAETLEKIDRALDRRLVAMREP